MDRHLDRPGAIKRVGIIGYPIKHSLSPVFQQAALDFHGIPARYEAWETPPEAVAAAVARLRQPGYLGMNVTVPHKQAVMPLLDEIDPLARRIGAVNTIVRRGDRLVGYNTDAAGFLRALQRKAGYDPTEQRALLIGAGGAARAVAFALLEAGVAFLAIANPRSERAAALAADLGGQTGDAEVCALGAGENELAGVVQTTDLLVNATPLGMRHTAGEHDLPLPAHLLRQGLLVCDLVYNPPQTPLLRAAAAAGAATLDGLPMLIYQGAAAFELWTGQQAPLGLMFERARAALAGA